MRRASWLTWVALITFLGPQAAVADSERERRGHQLISCSALMTILSSAEGFSNELASVSSIRFWTLGQAAVTLERGSMSNGKVMDLREAEFAEYQDAHRRQELAAIQSDVRRCARWDAKIVQLLATSGVEINGELTSGDALRQRRALDRLTEPPTPEELAAGTDAIDTDSIDRLTENSFAAWAKLEGPT